MFSRVLVANRGEIAVRVIRALHELGVEAVAVYSTADAGTLHTRLADRAVCIGPPSASESYLNMPSVVAAAETTGCDAVHPGYGFLSENPDFVRACEENDLVFVGPDADVMARMGDKVEAKRDWRPPGSRWFREPRRSGRMKRAPPPPRSAFPCCSRPPRAEAARECASSSDPRTWKMPLRGRAPRLWPLSATGLSTWRS